MILEEAEEKLMQALRLMTQLINKPTEQVKETAIAFIDDNWPKENPPKYYDGTNLNGNPDDLPF